MGTMGLEVAIIEPVAQPGDYKCLVFPCIHQMFHFVVRVLHGLMVQGPGKHCPGEQEHPQGH